MNPVVPNRYRLPRLVGACLVAACTASIAIAQADRNPAPSNDPPGVEILRGQAARDKAAALGLKYSGETSDGRIWKIDAFVDGFAHYIQTNNVTAAKSISTDGVWLGSPLDLTGAGVTIGMWDGGVVLNTHIEFLLTDVINMESVSTSSHATHVCGTMVARGLPQPSARGAAPDATMHAYDFANDGNEMWSAASNGLRLSNHSYGSILGWAWGDYSGNEGWHWFGNPDVNLFEDYRFGYYDFGARDWDNIAYNFPRYVIVKSAGNDRNDDGPGGPLYGHYFQTNGGWQYSIGIFRQSDGEDESIGTKSCAKNVLVVGAVNDLPNGYPGPFDVFPTDFSGFGPTDDGRVKPDLVANGHTLYSTDSFAIDGYSVKSGTSMSAPTVTGALALLLEHYRNTNPGTDPLSSTMRGLAIHTADPVFANAGPTPATGWGLMNTEKAADVITTDADIPYTISEHTLQNGEVQEFFARGQPGTWMIVTAAWTDPPGNVPPAVLNPTQKVLVNDIDVVVTRMSDGQEVRAWQLFGPTGILSGNDRDNVEKIEFAGQDAWYRISVSHKNSLQNNQQDYSLIITGASDAGVWIDCNNNGVPDTEELLLFGDCNSNGVIDDCEDTGNGDFDGDGTIEGADARRMFSWMRGPNLPPSNFPFFTCADFFAETFDIDDDGDLDLADVAEVQVFVTAP